MQEIQAEHAGGNLSMNELRDILEAKTGVDLDSFWDEWVLDTGVPSDENLYPGDLATLVRRRRPPSMLGRTQWVGDDGRLVGEESR